MTTEPAVTAVESVPFTPDEYRRLAEHATDLVVVTGADRRILWTTPNITSELGWRADELTGTLLVDLVHPDDRARTEAEREAIYARPAAPEESVPFLLRIRSRSGDYAWMSGTATATTDPVSGDVRVITGMHNVDDLVHARASARESERLYRLIAENASDIVTLVAPDGTLEWISPSVTRILGWGPAELIGTRPWSLVHPDDREAAAQSFAEASVPGVPPPPLLLRFLCAEGGYVWLSTSGSRTEGGRFLVSYRRVEDQVRAERALSESEERFQLLAENAQDVVFSLDTKAIIQWVSPSLPPLLGYGSDELIGQFGGILIHPEDLPILLDTATEAREGRPSTCRIRLVSKAGELRWFQVMPRALYDDNDALVGGVIGASDIHEEVLAREALQHEVDFDDLTGLAKRQLAVARIQDILDTRSSPGWALLCVGVDGMTAANQAYTYSAGDAILQSVAGRLVEAAGQEDRVARVAGDEFVVLLRDVVTASDAATAAERILAAVRGPVPLPEGQIDVTACVGVAFSQGQTADALLRDAVAAMRQASAHGTDRWAFLDGDAGEHAREALALQEALGRDVTDGLVRPWFMPLSDLADGQVVGFEALARWQRADESVWEAAAFIPMAENTGLIMRIDREILRQAAEVISSIPGNQHVAVNVSAATLASSDFVSFVVTELTRTGLSPHRLHLEVTETSLLRVTDRIRGTMETLAELGVVWWVDDFGTGFSSISHLRDLPVAGLKLDMSFTRELSLTGNHATNLARGLAGLAAGLGLATVAEGVETAEQVQVLIEQGWQRGQGAIFGLAQPPEAFTDERHFAGRQSDDA